MKKRILSLLLVLVMVVGLLPTVALAASGDPATQVHVIVENTTFTEASEKSNWLAPAWSGRKIDTWVTLADDLTMMDCIRLAIEAKGWTQTGAENGYISDINGVAEFGNGGGSGWMGTLNDWFTNKGFANYTAADGTLKAGDEICVMYTSADSQADIGKDLGADWGSSDKRVASVAVTGGTLSPAFTPDNHEYTLTLPVGSETANVTVVPTACNKQYQVHTYVGEQEYRRTETIPAAAGTDIVIKSGDPAWETANPNTEPAEVYTIHVATTGTLLTSDSLAITTIREDGSEGTDVSLSYSSSTATFSGTLARYTQLKQYNDAGFTATLTGLPEGATARLTDSTGTVLAEFDADGKASTDTAQTIRTGSRTMNYLFYITVTAQGKTETYTLSLKKTCSYWMYFKFELPEYNPNISYYGYPEGTLFQADENGNRTGKTGFDRSCWNYIVYVSPAIKQFGIAGNTVLNFNFRDRLEMTMLVNGETYIARSDDWTVIDAFHDNPVTLNQDKTVLEFIQDGRDRSAAYKNVELHTTVTVIRVKNTPEELTGFLNALPGLDDLTYAEHYSMVLGYQGTYDAYTDEEKAQLAPETVKKLQDSAARMEVLKKRHEDGIQNWKDLVNSYAGTITAENYADYYDTVRKSEADYLALSDAQRTALNNTAEKTAFDSAVELITKQSILDGSSIGKPTNYPDDFMMTALYFNLELGHEDTYYPAVFREIWTNRPQSLYDSYYASEKGLPYTLPGILKFEVKDESILEIKEVESEYKDGGLGGGGTYPAMKYYLVPKKAGTTTFTVTFTDKAGSFLGQIPEIPVHVNSPEETELTDLDKSLTNFTSASHTTKYDTWTYDDGTEGAEFSFHVNGDNGKVSVYNYLQYNEDGTPVETTYTADANGDVTVLLKDGYNGIEVSADYQGQTVTQVYALKGKVTRYVYANGSRPGEPLRTGDEAHIWTIGEPIPIHKILRIYNMSGKPVYLTDMNNQSLVYAQDSITAMWNDMTWRRVFTYSRIKAILTSSGEVRLTDGYTDYRGYGSAPGSEGDQGNTGEIADSTAFGYGKYADMVMQVAENANYLPEAKYEAVASDDGVVKAGEQITISIPTLPIEEFTTEKYLMYGKLTYATTIPGVSGIFSTWSRGTDSWVGTGVTPVAPEVALKNITFTVPAATPAGTYRIYGGYIDATYRTGGEAHLDEYAYLYEREMGDLTITVLPGAQQEVMDLIAAIGTVTENSGDAIKTAREAYDALTEAQQALVTNYEVLTAAEARFTKLTNVVNLVVTGEEETHAFADHIAYTVSAKNMMGLNSIEMTIQLSGDLLTDVKAEAAGEGWYIIGQTYQNGVLKVVAGNNAGASGDGDLLTVTAKPVGKGGEAKAQVTEAKLAGYDGEGEAYQLVNLDSASAATQVIFNVYDVNHDGVVNLLDVTRAQRWYGTDNAVCDVNHDGTVDINDLILILNNYFL